MITNTQGPETNCSFVDFPDHICKIFVFCELVFFLKSIHKKNQNSSIKMYSQIKSFFLENVHKN